MRVVLGLLFLMALAKYELDKYMDDAIIAATAKYNETHENRGVCLPNNLYLGIQCRDLMPYELPNGEAKKEIQKAEPTPVPYDVPFDVSIEVGMDLNDGKPVVRVRTNLPEGTQFMAGLVSPINWGGTGYMGEDKAEVSPTGVAEFGPFSDQGEALLPALYQVTISTAAAALQPESVRAVMGENGKNLTGNNISKFNIVGLKSEKWIYQKYVFNLHQDGSITIEEPIHNVTDDRA